MPWKMDSVKPGYPCSPAVLKFFREKRGWTQDKLSEVAGYSRRLIVKAEAGKSVASETIADLAEALSTEATPVYPEDLICDPVVFARRYIDAFYIHQGEAISYIESFLDPEVVFQVQGNPSEIPFAGTFLGVDGVNDTIQKFFSVLEVPKDYDHTSRYRYFGSGNEVIVWGESWIQPIGNPLTEPVPISIRMRFRRGKMILFDDRYDIKAAAAGIAQIKR